MECKNCLLPQEETVNYCASCGAKVIRARMSLPFLFAEFNHRYLNWDNSLWRTFITLMTRPERVITGYIEGTRRKYLNPFSYLGLALTLSGILLFFIQNVYVDAMNVNLMGSDLPPEVMQRVFDFCMDYSSFLFLLYIPIFAISAYLVLNKRDYYLTEQVISCIYILAHWSILSFPVSALALMTNPELYLDLGIPMLAAIMVYAIFAFQRVHGFRPAALVGRSLVFFLLVVIGYFGIIVLAYAVMFLTGVLSVDDIRPPA